MGVVEGGFREEDKIIKGKLWPKGRTPVVVQVPSSLDNRSADGEIRHKKVLHLWVLELPGLVVLSAGLQLQRLDFFHSKMELSHLVVDKSVHLSPCFVFA